MKLDQKSLSSLSREQKLALLDVIEEKRRRAKERKASFTPTEKQLPVLLSEALEKYVFCANGFGKTTMLVNVMHWAATGYDPVRKAHLKVPTVIYLVVDDPSKIEQKILPEYKKWHNLREDQLHKDGKPHIARITYDTGSVVHIITHEVNLLKLEGVEMEWLLFDEPPPRHVFIGLRRGGRLSGRPLKIFMAGTPLYQPWLLSEIWDKWVDGQLPNTQCFTGEISDNPHLEAGYKDQFGAFLTEEEKLTRFKGMFANLSGLALAHMWKPALHVIKKENLRWDNEWPTVVAIDPHPSKAHFAIKLGADPSGQLVVLDEYSKKDLARGFTHELIKRGWFEGTVVDIIYDSLGSADTTSGEGFRAFGEVVNEVLKEHGIGRARSTTFDDKSDEDFIERIRDALHVPEKEDNFGQKLPKLRVVEDCIGTISDIRHVQWVRDKRANENKPKLDISNKDYLACLKYALATNLYHGKRKDKSYVRRTPAYGLTTPSMRKRGNFLRRRAI